jgi:hypothetical protein
LRARDLKVFIRADLFQPGIEDVAWLQEIGRRGWLVFTKDQRIRQRSSELLALVNSRVRAFVLSAGEVTGDDQANIFLGVLARIRQWVAETPAPFIVRIEKSGRTQRIDKS